MPKHVSQATGASVRLYKYNTVQDLLFDLSQLQYCLSSGWNAFTSIMRNASAEKWGCSDAQAVAKFFKDSCVFGLSGKEKDKLPANLYSLCNQSKKRDRHIQVQSR